MTSLKYNQFTNIRQMLPNDQDFQLLVDTKDYLNLQTRCHQLELSHQKLDEQNKILANKIFELKEENSNLHKKVTGLTDDIRYLSQKGIQMSKSLMSLEEVSQSLRLSKAESELELGKKLQTVVVSKEQSEKKLIQQMAEIRKTKEELKQKSVQLQKILTVEKLSRHIQVSPNLKQVCVMGDLTSTQIEATMNANKSLKQKQADLQRSKANLSQELNQKNSQINSLKIQIQKVRNTYQMQIDQLSCSRSQSLEQTQIMKKQISLNQQKLLCLQKKCACLQEQKQNLMKMINQLKKATQMLKMQNSHLCQQRALISQQMSQFQVKMKMYEQNIKQKNDQCSLLAQHIQQYEQQLMMCQSKMCDMNKKNSDLMAQTNSLCRQIQDLRNYHSSTQRELDALKCELCQKEKYCSQLSCQISQLKAVNQKKSYDLNFMASSLHSKIEQLSPKLSSLEKQNIMLVNQIKNKQCTVEELKSVLSSSLSHKQQLMCQIQQKQNIVKMQQQRLNSQQFMIQQRKKQIQSMKQFIQQNLNKNLQENNNSSQKIHSQNQIIQELKQSNAILKQQVQLLTQKYGSVVSTIQNQQLENKKCTNMIKQLEQKLSLQSAKIVQYEQINKNLKLTQQSQQSQSQQFYENKIQCLETQINRLKELLDGSRKLQKQYEEIIESMQKQKQKQKKNSPPKAKKQQKDQLEQVKQAIFNYFLELACNLHEVGNLDESDIAGIIQQNEQIVKNHLTKACESFTQFKNIKGAK